MLGVVGGVVVVVVVVAVVVAVAGAVVEAGAVFAAGRDDLMSSFLRFWKGASKSTVSATEAKNIDINSLVSSCSRKLLQSEHNIQGIWDRSATHNNRDKVVVMMHMPPAPDIVEEDGELRQVDGVRQLRGHLEAAPGEHAGHFVCIERCGLDQLQLQPQQQQMLPWTLTLVAVVRDKDNPREEQAPGDGCKGGIDGRMRGVVHIVDVAHGRRPQHRSEHTYGGSQPAQAQLQLAQLRVLILAQHIAQQYAHDVHRGAVWWERVHVVGCAEQALYAVNESGKGLDRARYRAELPTLLTWYQSKCSWTIDSQWLCSSVRLCPPCTGAAG